MLDSISQSKREQKEKLSKYAVVMLQQQVQRSISLLLNCGVKITDEQILDMIAEEIKKEKTKKLVGKNDVTPGVCEAYLTLTNTSNKVITNQVWTLYFDLMSLHPIYT